MNPFEVRNILNAQGWGQTEYACIGDFCVPLTEPGSCIGDVCLAEDGQTVYVKNGFSGFFGDISESVQKLGIFLLLMLGLIMVIKSR